MEILITLIPFVFALISIGFMLFVIYTIIILIKFLKLGIAFFTRELER